MLRIGVMSAGDELTTSKPSLSSLIDASCVADGGAIVQTAGLSSGIKIFDNCLHNGQRNSPSSILAENRPS